MFSERRRYPVPKGTLHLGCIYSHAEACFPSFALDSEGLECSQLLLLHPEVNEDSVALL